MTDYTHADLLAAIDAQHAIYVRLMRVGRTDE